MSALALPSFHIQGFRGFSDLRIERLGRVNLIVGKNNVGKSSLLEALQLYANRGYLPLIWDLLAARDEGRLRFSAFRDKDPEDVLLALRYLFSGYPDLDQRHTTSLALSITDSPDRQLLISVDHVPAPVTAETGYQQGRLPLGVVDDEIVVLIIRWANQKSFPMYPLEIVSTSRHILRDASALNCMNVSAHGLSNTRMSKLWDNVALTSLESRVVNALHIIANGVEAVGFVADPQPSKGRIPIVKIAGFSEPTPLRSLGDGMQRLLGIALALVNASDGILLVDEIENGLHYLVQPDLWRLIFKTARQLNVQVFATTHSWDCIQAFQQVAQEDTESEGVLIRLEARKDKIAATLFDEEELAIATREQIEVR